MVTEALRVLFRDDWILALDKPAGVLSVPGRDLSEPSMSVLAAQLHPEALSVHRLDRETSGVLIFALGRKSLRELGQSFEHRRVEKKYLALSRGRLEQPLLCETPLLPWDNGHVKPALAGEAGAMKASTDFIPLERFADATWIEARPRTGRTHQIRVHLASVGHPLLFDERYATQEPIRAGDLHPGAGEEIVLSRTPLHASALRFPHPSGQGYLQLESPMPADLARCLELLRAQRREA